MQDDFDSGLGLPDDDLVGGSAADLGDIGAGGMHESEGGGGEGSRRSSGGARPDSRRTPESRRALAAALSKDRAPEEIDRSPDGQDADRRTADLSYEAASRLL